MSWQIRSYSHSLPSAPIVDEAHLFGQITSQRDRRLTDRLSAVIEKEAGICLRNSPTLLLGRSIRQLCGEMICGKPVSSRFGYQYFVNAGHIVCNAVLIGDEKGVVSSRITGIKLSAKPDVALYRREITRDISGGLHRRAIWASSILSMRADRSHGHKRKGHCDG